MIKNIIFDFDGVLVDTKEMLFGIFRKINPKISFQDFLDHHNGNIYSEPLIKFSNKEMNYLFILYRNSVNASFMKKSKMMISKIPSNINLFIVSSNDELAIKSTLKEAGVIGRFKKILGKQSGLSKTRKFISIIEEYSLKESESIFITDTLGDLKEANKCNINTIAVTFGFHSYNVLIKAKPTFIVNSIESLNKKIQFLINRKNQIKSDIVYHSKLMPVR